MGNLAYKQKHKEKGLCTYCSNPVKPGFLNCEKHYQSHYEASTKWNRNNKEYKRQMARLIKQKLKRDGRCLKCGKPLEKEIDAEFVTCLNCRIGCTRPRWVKHGINTV